MTPAAARPARVARPRARWSARERRCHVGRSPRAGTPARASSTPGASVFDLDGVKNFRDLAEATDAVKPGRAFRTATPGEATEADASLILRRLNVKSLVDLRSDDEFEPILGEVQSAFETRWFSRADAPTDEWPVAGDAPTRYLVPMLDYDRYYGAIYERMSALEKAKAAVFSAQATLVDPTNQRRLFVSKVNAGGLRLLNEVMLDTSGPEIRAALGVVASASETRPCAFYCKVGKDRTGLIAALALHCCGASEAQIVDDYVRSDGNALRKAALGGGRVEAGLAIDYSRFRGAPAEVMEHALAHAKRKHGSLDGYLNHVGFGADDRERLRRALCD
jgi:protein tyrosine/serine phosphatase